MANRSLKIASDANPFLEDPAQHEFAKVIEGYLKSVGIEPNHCKQVRQDHLLYSFVTDSICVHFSLYKTLDDKELFVLLQSCLGVIPKHNELPLMRLLLSEISDNPSPMRFAIDDIEGESITVACLQFRSYAAGITSDHLKLRLKTIVEYGEYQSQRLTLENGLLPLPINWVKNLH